MAEPRASSPYPPAIVAFARDATHRGELPPESYVQRLIGHAINRSCGDKISLSLGCDHAEDAMIITAAAFDGEGCALCTAATAALCQALTGQPLANAVKIIALLYDALLGVPSRDTVIDAEGLAAFVAVAPFPARHRCVTLCAEAAQNALDSLP